MSPAYQESEDHIPNPLYQTGVVDTTGVTGDLGGRIENISPVFAQAKADAFASAVDAVEDPDVDESEQVVFHDDDAPLTHDEQVENLKAAAEDAAANPQLEDPALTPAAQQAAEDDPDADPAVAQPNGDSDDTVSAEDGPAERAARGDGGTDGVPADDDSKAKWVEYAKANDIEADQSLRKEEYVAAVKAGRK